MKNLIILALTLLISGYGYTQTSSNLADNQILEVEIDKQTVKGDAECYCVQVLRKGKYYYYSQSAKNGTAYEWHQEVKRQNSDLPESRVNLVSGDCPSRCNCKTPPRFGSCKGN